ncbi:MAG: tryptophanyl-tRNA synthetase [Actinomycetota bacterium]|nr:tryptophanyl-tRNA synthetase [Actinomycetota bacterium]
MGGLTLNQNLSDSRRTRVFSGIQPTGEAHVGNYFGAIRNWVAQQDEFESFFCIVDLHAMTLPWTPAELGASTLAKAAELIACGIDPSRSVVFVQSHVAAHSELAWILQCVARMGELRRMVQFKEKSKGDTESVGVGVFTYPVLQAADVLLYQAHGVPVGEDQRQHIELMRDLAIRFNSAFGDTFVVPEAWIPPADLLIFWAASSNDMIRAPAGRPQASIQLVDPPEAIVKKIKSAVTDSGSQVSAGPDKPELSNLLMLMSLTVDRPVQDLEREFSGGGYGAFKQALADALIDRLSPIRERFHELMGDRTELERTLEQGASTAASEAEATMRKVWANVGLGTRR